MQCGISYRFSLTCKTVSFQQNSDGIRTRYFSWLSKIVIVFSYNFLRSLVKGLFLDGNGVFL